MFKHVPQVHGLIVHATERKGFAVEGNVAGIERHPAERLSPSESEPCLFVLQPGFDVLLANALHRVGMNIEFFANARGESHQIEWREPTRLAMHDT
jgi:hypothetical protein